MTVENIKTILDGTGYPVAYHHFDKSVKAPFIVYHFPESDHFNADGEIYKHIEVLNIELYSAKKNLKAERAVEAALAQMGLTWSREEEYIEDEKLYMEIFETSCIITEE